MQTGSRSRVPSGIGRPELLQRMGTPFRLRGEEIGTRQSRERFYSYSSDPQSVAVLDSHPRN